MSYILSHLHGTRAQCKFMNERCMSLPLALMESFGEFANHSHHFYRSKKTAGLSSEWQLVGNMLVDTHKSIQLGFGPLNAIGY